MGKQVVRGPQGELKLVPAKKKLDVMTIRVLPDLYERFERAMALEAAHGPAFAQVPSMNAVVVQMVGEYVQRWESISASPEARHAGKVLRKAAGGRRG